MSNNLAEEIRKALDAATPGPWYAEQEEWPGNENLQYWVGNHEDGLGAFVRYEDAYLAAKSIEWLRWQQGEIERLTKERDDYMRYAEEYRLQLQQLREELEQVKAERDDYRKVVEHYADRRNHPPFWLYDKGQRARDILAKYAIDGGTRP